MSGEPESTAGPGDPFARRMPDIGERLAWEPPLQVKTIIQGPELWRRIGPHSFCYWDRWFLRLALAERDGFDGLGAFFEDRRRRLPFEQRDAEIKLAHLADLRLRLQDADLSPADVLGAEDAADPKLEKKARTKIFDQHASYHTPPMIYRPGVILKARARYGYWPRFPVSPVEYARRLYTLVEAKPYFNGMAAMGLAMRLQKRIERADKPSLPAAQRLALFRAAATVCVMGMDRADESFGALGQTFEQIWIEYLGVPLDAAGIDSGVFYRDLVEFIVWEDYGLVGDVTPYFASLPPGPALQADKILKATIALVTSLGFEYEAQKAVNLSAGLRAAQPVVWRRLQDPEGSSASPRSTH